ncbi:MAG: macro domain-containing protein [Bacteroidales bacterium]
MIRKKFQDITIELTKGDITNQPDIDAIVNAANAFLRTGGGVAGAIHEAAGPDLEKESVSLGPIKPGQAVITSAYKLPNKNVIHCLGPVYQRDLPHDKLLASCYSNSLELADKYDLKSIAFPAISTGAFGYPIEEAAKVALNAIKEKTPFLNSVKIVRMVLFSDSDYDAHEVVFKKW